VAVISQTRERPDAVAQFVEVSGGSATISASACLSKDIWRPDADGEMDGASPPDEVAKHASEARSRLSRKPVYKLRAATPPYDGPGLSK